jgi:hypothetical protein
MSNPIEDELNAIRIKHYEETKGMTIDERLAFIKAKTDPINQRLGITPVKMPIVRYPRPQQPTTNP